MVRIQCLVLHATKDNVVFSGTVSRYSRNPFSAYNKAMYKGMHEYQYIRLTWHLFFTGFLIYLMGGFHLIEYIYLLAWTPDMPVPAIAVLMFHTFVLVRGYRVWKYNCSIHPEEWKRIMFFLMWYELDIIAVCVLQHLITDDPFAWETVIFFLILTVLNMIYYVKKKYLFWLDENMTESE